MIEDALSEPDLSLGPRSPLALVPGQVRCQLLMLVRSPLPAFITLVVPVMLLVALDLVTPEMTLRSLGGVRVAQFLTPAMASFAVLNAGFVDTVVGTTLARERGILKLLRATPLPSWVYLAGRLGATLVVGAGSVAVVTLIGLNLLHAHLAPGGLGPFAAAAAAGLVASFALGVAVAALVTSADSALPVSYAILLPIAFISGVFFPAPTEAHWLRALSDALPAAPVARALEAAFARGAAHGPTVHQLLVLAGWTLGATGLAAWRFSWAPTGGRHRRGAHGTSHRPPGTAPTP
ncbi:MAG: ABC transporter permease [Actinomycetota bacterium]|nr:ABC transporter permease [Actinomycetota bacterium]